MKRCFFIAAMALSLSSCGFGPAVSYKVGLSNVEAPADAKRQYGQTKIVSLEKEGKTNYRYEDDYLDVTWYVGRTQLAFGLKNKSGHSIKIPWDDVVYINVNGQSGRVMHSGVKYIDRNSSQPASVVPKGASLNDVIIPTDNIYYVSGKYGGWSELDLFNFKIDLSNFDISKQAVVGQSIRILLPVVMEGVKNEYVFEFKIQDVLKQ